MEKVLSSSSSFCISCHKENYSREVDWRSFSIQRQVSVSSSLSYGNIQSKTTTSGGVFLLSMGHNLMPIRCSRVSKYRNSDAVGSRGYKRYCASVMKKVQRSNFSSCDDCNLTVEEELSVEDRCGSILLSPPSSSKSDFERRSGISEVNLSFLEETDERVLSKRILSLSRSNKIRSALELFMSMDSAGLRPNPHACNSLVSCILRGGPLDNALRVFEVMRKNGVATGHTYSLILKAVANVQGCHSALRMFDEIKREGVSDKSLDIIVYNTMITACGKEKNWAEAERLWGELKENGFQGTVVTFSLLVSTFVQCGQTELAISAYNEMIESNQKPGEDVMKAIISSCAKEGKWIIALNVLEKMLSSGIQPNIIVFNTVINCLGKAGETDHAFRIYELLKSSGHCPDAYTWNALLNALYRCRLYADCIRLFENISKQKNLEINIHLYNTVLMSCQRLGLWERSLQFLWKMEESGMQLTTASYNLVLASCETARKPKVALQVYQHMIHKNCSPDNFSYLILARSCIWGSLWTEVEYILGHVDPDVSLYNVVIQGLFLKGKETRAEELYQKMRSLGLQPDGKTRALMLQRILKETPRHHPRYVESKGRGIRHKHLKGRQSSRTSACVEEGLATLGCITRTMLFKC